MGPVGYQTVKPFSGSYKEGISSEISIHLFGTHKSGSWTIKGENGAVVVLLAWEGATQRIVLLETEKQVEGTIYDSYISSANPLLANLQSPSRIPRPTLHTARAQGNSHLHRRWVSNHAPVSLRPSRNHRDFLGGHLPRDCDLS